MSRLDPNLRTAVRFAVRYTLCCFLVCGLWGAVAHRYGLPAVVNLASGALIGFTTGRFVDWSLRRSGKK